MDKIRLLRRYTSLNSQLKFNETLGLANGLVMDGDLNKKTEKYRTIFYKQYEGKGESTGLAFVFYSVKKKPAISIEFSPFKLSKNDWAHAGMLISMLGLGNAWATFRMTSIEFDVDVNLPLKDLVFFAPGVTTSNPQYLPKGTFYIGSKTSHRRFCIYDKQKQLADVKYVISPKTRTRIEVVHQGLQLTLDKMDSLQNPFGTLIVVRKAELSALCKKLLGDFDMSAFCNCIHFGMTGHDAYWEQPPAARKRISKLVRPIAMKLNGEDGTWQKVIAIHKAKLSALFSTYTT